MIDRDELWKRKINPEVAKEVLAQSEKRLADLLDAKKSFETRAATLLTAFSSLALALIGAAAAFFTNNQLQRLGLLIPIGLFLSSLPLIFSSWCMMQTLQPARYGNLGTEPSMWLVDNFIDTDNATALPLMQATIAWDTQQRIDSTFASNNDKASNISIGSSAALASPILLALVLGVSLAAPPSIPIGIVCEAL